MQLVQIMSDTMNELSKDEPDTERALALRDSFAKTIAVCFTKTKMYIKQNKKKENKKGNKSREMGKALPCNTGR